MKNRLLTAIPFCVMAIAGVIAAAFVTGAGAGNPPGDTTPGASHEPVTLCHATSSEKNPYVVITVNFNSIADAQSVGGHGDHADDIIPPYAYIDPQGTVNYPGQGDQSILANGCEVDQTTTTTPTTTTTVATTTTGETTTAPATTTVETTTTTPATTIVPTTSTVETTTDQTTTTATPGTPTTAGPSNPTPSGSAPSAAKPKPQGVLAAQAANVAGRVSSERAKPGQLPFTGFPGWIVALVGSAMLIAGVAVRRLTA
jgi:hypothetical protein